MLNADSLSLIVTFLTSFAEAYNEGTYGSGDYNETSTTGADSPTTTSPTPTSSSTTTPVTTQQSTTVDDEPTTSTDDQPRITTAQPTKDTTVADTETSAVSGTDPLWVIIASVIAFSALIALVVIAVKKLRQ